MSFSEKNLSLNIYEGSGANIAETESLLKTLVIYFTRQKITENHLLARYFRNSLEGEQLITNYETEYRAKRGSYPIILDEEARLLEFNAYLEVGLQNRNNQLRNNDEIGNDITSAAAQVTPFQRDLSEDDNLPLKLARLENQLIDAEASIGGIQQPPR